MNGGLILVHSNSSYTVKLRTCCYFHCLVVVPTVPGGALWWGCRQHGAILPCSAPTMHHVIWADTWTLLFSVFQYCSRPCCNFNCVSERMCLTGRWILCRFYIVVILDVAVWINIVILHEIKDNLMRLWWVTALGDKRSTPRARGTVFIWACVGKVIYVITHVDGFRGQLFGGFAGVEGLLGWTLRLVMLVIWNGGAQAEGAHQSLHKASFWSHLWLINISRCR